MEPVDVTIWMPAVMRLREVHAKAKAGGYNTRLEPWLTGYEEVFAQFQPLFAAEAIPNLSAKDFLSFLPFNANHHWSDLTRHQRDLVADMELLRAALLALADDTQPIDQRLDYALETVDGMGVGTATAILLIMFPQQYGVRNGTSEAGMESLGLLPESARGATPGQNYMRFNAVLNRLSSALKTDLWTLDALWYYLTKG